MTKPTKWHVGPAKTDQPGYPPSLIVFAVRMKKAWCPQLPIVHTSKTDQTGQMPRVVGVFTEGTCHFVIPVLF